MKDKEKATIKELLSTIKLLDADQRLKLLWLGEGMAMASKRITYEEIKNS